MKVIMFAIAALVSIGINSLQAQELVAEPAEAVAVAKAKSTPAKTRPVTVAVDLLKELRIIGTLTEANQLMLKSSFGEITVPFSEIAGIRFASADDVSTTVVMLNGDSVTGATDLRALSVETEWGTAKVNGSSIQSIMFVPELVWTSAAGLSGKRWTLVDAKSQSPRGANQQNQLQSQPVQNQSVNNGQRNSPTRSPVSAPNNQIQPTAINN